MKEEIKNALKYTIKNKINLFWQFSGKYCERKFKC